MSKKSSVKMFKSNTNLKEDLRMSVSFRNDKKVFCDLHKHQYIETELILSGTCKNTINGVEYNFKRGDVYLMLPSDMHIVYSEEPVKYVNLSFGEDMLKASMLNQIALKGSNIIAALNEEEIETAENILKAISCEFNSKKPSKTLLKMLIECFMVLSFGKNEKTSAETRSTVALKRVLGFLNMHFTENPSLKAAAEVAHYNVSHFSNYFHNQMQVTYSEYLNNLKVNRAKDLLMSTDLKIYEIALKSGFSTQVNFQRVFKKKTGLTPLQFRAENKQKNTAAD